MMNLYQSLFKSKKVLITGDTGFKGSWLAIWLIELGAEVFGYALPPKTHRDNFVETKLNEKMKHENGDIRDKDHLLKFFNKVGPDFAFHLAAQPLVLESYKNPHYTFETNVMGTVNFFEAVHKTKSIRAALNITSDKCYQNNEWVWGYRENDPMSGKDPYSASKGCSELVTNAYLNSFFGDDKQCAIASARAGNVIGGGDWADYRIVPDFFKAVRKKEKLIIRNPNSTRPWQHVLEPLGGYLLLASKLFQEGNKFSGGWNFGPLVEANHKVIELIRDLIKLYNEGETVLKNDAEKLHEADFLKLDISKAIGKLKWKPILTYDELIKFTVDGYRVELNGCNIYEERKKQIIKYINIAKQRKIEWVLSN